MKTDMRIRVKLVTGRLVEVAVNNQRRRYEMVSLIATKAGYDANFDCGLSYSTSTGPKYWTDPETLGEFGIIEGLMVYVCSKIHNVREDNPVLTTALPQHVITAADYSPTEVKNASISVGTLALIALGTLVVTFGAGIGVGVAI